MKAKDIMTTSPACCTPEDTAQEAANLMQESRCGCIPVVRDGGSKQLVGVITDRDLALRGVASGKPASTLAKDLMSTDVSCCAPEDDVQDVERIMTERQVRRVPVIDDAGSCLGMIAQADLARQEGRATTEDEVGRVVERISQPTMDSRTDADVGLRAEGRGSL